ncbi:MAG: cytochrome c3 family protein [Candidatus Neomarinimicrobiota bacterium]
MKRISIVTALILGILGADDPVVNKCLDCHLELEEELAAPAELFSQDIHFRLGFSCADCHGGDATTEDFDEAKSVEAGFIGVPEKIDVPGICGRCHDDPAVMRKFNPNIPVDQTEKYWTSQHGKSLKKGITSVATCSSCHGIHGIFPKNDSRSRVYPGNVAATCAECHGFKPLMDQFGLPTSVYDDYAESVHGIAVLERGDFSSPTCNDCHGNHGAMPPDVGSIKMVCGMCHANNYDLFRKTKMSQIFEIRGLHGCEVCHNNHRILHPSDEKVSVAEGGVCIRCHRPGDSGYAESQLMYTALMRLKETISEAERKVSEAENRGMNVSDALFDIQTATDALIRSRTMIHTFDAGEVQATAEPGIELALVALGKGEEAIVEHKNRRVWLGISTFFITFLSVILYIYIKRIETE